MFFTFRVRFIIIYSLRSAKFIGITIHDAEEKKLHYAALPPYELKRSLGLTRGKSDKIDSFNIARYAYLHRDEIKLSSLPSAEIQELKFLINERFRIIKMQTIDKQTMTEFKKYSSKQTVKRAQKRLKEFDNQIKEIEKEIEQIIKANPKLDENYRLAKSVVGIGLVNAVMFIIFTNNFEAFTNGRQYACYSGIAPFELSSGTSVKGKTKVSYLANKQIKTQLTQAARSVVQHDCEFKRYYQRKQEQGKEHGTIMNAVKFKLIIRVFATIQRGTPYVKLNMAG